MPRPITIEIRHDRRETGQIISAVALAPTGRILGVVDLLVPLMPGFKLAGRIGQAGEDAIIGAAKELARRLAEAVETEPQQG